jgi:putative ABC transport system permease protein
MMNPRVEAAMVPDFRHRCASAAEERSIRAHAEGAPLLLISWIKRIFPGRHMNVLLDLDLSARSLDAHKARTALTGLGVAIGVGAFVTIVAVGRGAQDQLASQIQAAGTNIVVVMAGNRTVGGVRQGQGAAGTLTADDAKALRETVPGIQWLTSLFSTRAQLVFGNQNWSTIVQGTDVDWPDMRAWTVAAGRFFTADEAGVAAKVAVLGSVVRDQLFGANASAVGETLRINQQPFTVVGVLTPKGQSGMGRDQDDAVFVPYTTVQKKLRGITTIDSIMLSTVSDDDMAATVESIAALMRQRHRIRAGNPDDFMVLTIAEMGAVQTQATQTMTLLLSCVAAVSLLVGGIGVMNIMLVSVTARTQEIGLRMAVGARSRDILGQFLLEALLLTVGGGLAGVVTGIAASRIATAAVGWPTSVSAEAAMLGLGVAVATGVCFGLFPARKAAALDPVEAMRSE